MTDEPLPSVPLEEKPTPEQLDRWYGWLEQPAIYVDHYTLDIWPSAQVVRFAFGEYIAKGVRPKYRAGFAMPLNDARRLLRTLTRVFKEEDERLAKLSQGTLIEEIGEELGESE